MTKGHLTLIRCDELPVDKPEPFTTAVFVTLPATITTEKQAREFVSAVCSRDFASWTYVANYYGEELTPRNDGQHPDFA